MKTKNHILTNYHDNEDKCPNCGAPCNIVLDLDDNDYCNDCRL